MAVVATRSTLLNIADTDETDKQLIMLSSLLVISLVGGTTWLVMGIITGPH